MRRLRALIWPALFWATVVWIFMYATSCGAVAAWLAAPASEGGAACGSSVAAAAASPSNAEVLVDVASSATGMINPFGGYAVGALGRLTLGRFFSRRR